MSEPAVCLSLAGLAFVGVLAAAAWIVWDPGHPVAVATDQDDFIRASQRRYEGRGAGFLGGALVPAVVERETPAWAPGRPTADGMRW